MVYNYSSSIPTVRTEQYTSVARLEIRALGTEEWYKPPAYEDWQADTHSNLTRATFTTGGISVLQRAVKPSYKSERRLESAVYMWQATFNTADLHDIRVRETKFGHSAENNFRVCVEMMAVSKVAPTGHGLFVDEGTLEEHVLNNAKETSESTASSSGLATISDRWASGEQEIKLTFTRTTQIERTPGKDKPQGTKKAIEGAKVWVWPAFLAFLTGEDWTFKTHAIFTNSPYISLADIVNKDSLNPHVEFEKKDDDWILIKIDKTEQQNRAARAACFGITDAVGPSTFKPSIFFDRPSASALGKRKMTESVEEAGGGKRWEIETRESLKTELLKRQHRVEFLREDENRIRVKVEEEEECIRRLKLRLEELDR